MPANSVPFKWYGLLQVAFVIILFLNFILTITFVLVKNDVDGGTGKLMSEKLILPLLTANAVLLLMSFLVLYILTYRATTADLVGNLRMRKRTASFKVAFISWILTSSETMLRLIALFDFKGGTFDNRCNAPWESIAGYHMLLMIQTTYQVFCLYVYDKNKRLRREGQGWLVTRKSFLILMAFANCYFWLLNVAKIKILVDLTSDKMEEFFSSSVERIIYTLNRASTLAYHVESAQLFYKFYEHDSADPLNAEDEDEDHEYPDYGFQIVETDSGKGVWLGFFLFGLLVFFAVGSFLVRRSIHDVHYFATVSTVAVMVTIFCITLKTTSSSDNVDDDAPQQSQSVFEDIISYLAGEQVGHLRVLLFYSICAVSYHFLLVIRVCQRGGEMDVYQPVREGCKGVACISLTVFMFWMSHNHRKLRCWRDLNVMFWVVLTLLSLDLIEETFEHDNQAKEALQAYALPLAIDFKTYVIIHTFSDMTTAKADYRRELRQNAGREVRNIGNSRASTPSVVSNLSSW